MVEQNNNSSLISASTVFVVMPSIIFSSETQNQFYNATIKSRVEKHSGSCTSAEQNIFIAYFTEVANAVNCTINILETINSYNEKARAAEKISVQIGMHYGELFVLENIPQGEIVDVAKDIAQISPANKIYISREVYNRARVKLLVQMTSLGEQTLPKTQIPKIIFNVDWELVEINLSASLRKIPGETIGQKIKQVYEPRKEQNKTLIFLVFGIIIALLLYMRYQKWL